jgi:hypothetical protein
MVDSQICQIESDYKQYFFKIRTFKHLEIKKIHYSFIVNHSTNHRKKAVVKYLQPSKLIIQQ